MEMSKSNYLDVKMVYEIAWTIIWTDISTLKKLLENGQKVQAICN